jgi:polyvinyl alcohol dehydrogenase (cytochrome)
MLRTTLALAFTFTFFSIADQAALPDGQRIFIEQCAMCHRDNGGGRAPQPAVLRQLTRQTIVQVLETGVMKSQGANLSTEERQAVAAFLSEQNSPAPEITTGFCAPESRPPNEGSSWLGWGADLSNTRFQPAEQAGLTRESVKKLKVKWAFGFPGGARSAQPVIFGGRLLIGGDKGVYSLDAKNGCIHWIFKDAASVRAAVAVSDDGKRAMFGDSNADVFAVDAITGRLIWKTHVDPNPLATITGAPLLVKDRLFVPLSSGEEGSAINPYYECCKFRGSMVALDVASGHQIWKTYAIPEVPKLVGKNARGVSIWGPSGAPIWASPTADLKRSLVYVATGNNYSDPPESHSDAIIALAMNDGHVVWSRQLTTGDRWNLACMVRIDLANCPPDAGGDFDFGAAPILAESPDGRAIILAAQKSGFVYALDPEQKGRVVWQRRLAQGGELGGLEWGGSWDRDRAYLPISDWRKDNPTAGGGLVAVDISSGKEIWKAPAVKPDCARTPGCDAAQIAPSTSIPGVVFSGSLDGHLRAYDATNGQIFWDFNVARNYDTVDGVEGRGGSLNASGPAVADGMLYVSTGQGQGMPGNVLLAFSLNGQ